MILRGRHGGTPELGCTAPWMPHSPDRYAFVIARYKQLGLVPPYRLKMAEHIAIVDEFSALLVSRRAASLALAEMSEGNPIATPGTWQTSLFTEEDLEALSPRKKGPTTRRRK